MLSDKSFPVGVGVTWWRYGCYCRKKKGKHERDGKKCRFSEGEETKGKVNADFNVLSL
jgi:hypothetical protein